MLSLICYLTSFEGEIYNIRGTNYELESPYFHCKAMVDGNVIDFRTKNLDNLYNEFEKNNIGKAYLIGKNQLSKPIKLIYSKETKKSNHALCVLETAESSFTNWVLEQYPKTIKVTSVLESSEKRVRIVLVVLCLVLQFFIIRHRSTLMDNPVKYYDMLILFMYLLYFQVLNIYKIIYKE